MVACGMVVCGVSTSDGRVSAIFISKWDQYRSGLMVLVCVGVC